MPDDQEPAAPETKAAAPGFKPPSFTDALRQSFVSLGRKGAGRAQPATGTEADRVRVTYIDKRERLIGFFLGGVLGALAIVLFFNFRHYLDKGHPKLTGQAHNAAPEVLAIGLVIGALIVGATFSKRRALLGFSLLLGGLALLQLAGLFGLIYLGVGLWMVFRAMRRPRPAGASAGAGTPAKSTSARATSTTKGARSAPRPAPGASKRYTPPRPHPKPVQPAAAAQGSAEPTGNRLTSWLRR